MWQILFLGKNRQRFCRKKPILLLFWQFRIKISGNAAVVADSLTSTWRKICWVCCLKISLQNPMAASELKILSPWTKSQISEASYENPQWLNSWWLHYNITKPIRIKLSGLLLNWWNLMYRSRGGFFITILINRLLNFKHFLVESSWFT